ncbi:CGH_1_HP_G0082120.mRNA.1.CDS.1 [Saccharomyces cerevisiae]|nr:CGH_1_HP_G0082120.mRNA.1.CDS.1 [Saccharomyces cerevisiae]CAI6926330.1 CGH_1_HP_G0082120.mRNA.1.CDS.1 [Saccharomyces cerevisiae]
MNITTKTRTRSKISTTFSIRDFILASKIPRRLTAIASQTFTFQTTVIKAGSQPIQPTLFLTHCINKCYQTVSDPTDLKLALRDALEALDHERIGLSFLKRRHFKCSHQASSLSNASATLKKQEDHDTFGVHTGIIHTANFFMFNASSDIFQRN